MERKKGFTLIELLVVISIIAMLMSILMPALGKAKALAQNTICKTNLHSWMLAWQMYFSDFDGKLTANDEWWYVSVGQYLGKNKGSRYCPLAKRTFLEGNEPTFASWILPKPDPSIEYSEYSKYGPLANGSYGIVEAAFRRDEQGNVTTEDYARYWQRIDAPNSKKGVLMAEMTWWKSRQMLVDDKPPRTLEVEEMAVGSRDFDQRLRRVTLPRHGDHINALFLDMSIREIGLRAIYSDQVYWHKEWGNEFTIPPDWEEAKWMKHMSNKVKR